jgi:aminodeoxychorismate lyase
MIVSVNGRFVPAAEAMVSVFDRGFLYGDGLFETILCLEGHPVLWSEHLARLEAGARALGMGVPSEPAALEATVRALLERNRLGNALLRLHLTRGVGPRGYSPRGANSPTLVLSVHPGPQPESEPPRAWRLHTAAVRLPAGDRFAAFKTADKLRHVLARAEAETAGADEALLLNADGHVAEAAAANVFWWEPPGLRTPPVATGALAGVTRAAILRLAAQLGWTCQETLVAPSALATASGVFLTLSSLGIVEATHLDGQPLATDPRTLLLRNAWWEFVRREIDRARR